MREKKFWHAGQSMKPSRSRSIRNSHPHLLFPKYLLRRSLKYHRTNGRLATTYNGFPDIGTSMKNAETLFGSVASGEFPHPVVPGCPEVGVKHRMAGSGFPVCGPTPLSRRRAFNICPNHRNRWKTAPQPRPLRRPRYTYPERIFIEMGSMSGDRGTGLKARSAGCGFRRTTAGLPSVTFTWMATGIVRWAIEACCLPPLTFRAMSISREILLLPHDRRPGTVHVRGIVCPSGLRVLLLRRLL